MTTAGTSRADGARLPRAVVACLALYALVLQAVLGGIAALPSFAAQQDVICQTLIESGAPADPQDAHHHHAACCTAAVFAATAAPEPSDSTLVPWPLRRAERLTWSHSSPTSARAPPGIAASPRAPPLA